MEPTEIEKKTKAEQAIIAAIKLVDAQPTIGPSFDPTFLDIGRLVDLEGQYSNSLHSWQEGEILRAVCEWLNHQFGRPATLTEVAIFLEQPWQQALLILEAYPPVMPLIAYTLYLRAHSEVHSMYPGSSSHAEGVISNCTTIIETCLDFVRRQSEEALREGQFYKKYTSKPFW